MRPRFLPISIETLHEDAVDCLIIQGEMLRDFGPWKKGEQRILTFDLRSGTCKEFDDVSGDVITSVNLFLGAEDVKVIEDVVP